MFLSNAVNVSIWIKKNCEKFKVFTCCGVTLPWKQFTTQRCCYGADKVVQSPGYLHNIVCGEEEGDHQHAVAET